MDGSVMNGQATQAEKNQWYTLLTRGAGGQYQS